MYYGGLRMAFLQRHCAIPCYCAAPGDRGYRACVIMGKVINTNNFKVRAKFELHGIPGARIQIGEVMVDANSERSTDWKDIAGVLSVYKADDNKQIYWCNTSGGATNKV
jgi:hypothetical protein